MDVSPLSPPLILKRNLRKAVNMGHQEAIEDNIRFEKPNANTTLYYPKCKMCDKDVKSWNYSSKLQYTCKECKLEMKLADKKDRIDNNRESKERKLTNAIGRIKTKACIDKYEKAITIVESKLHTDGWFQSTEEIMAALELLKNGIGFNHQVKIGKYKADFVIKSEKIVLEIDGTLYHTKETVKREIIRDDIIVLSLGFDWDVIRITDTLINQDITKLVRAFRKVKERRNNLRKNNNGKIPDWYSDRKL